MVRWGSEIGHGAAADSLITDDGPAALPAPLSAPPPSPQGARIVQNGARATGLLASTGG